jgi:hypothetical protein
MAGLARRKHENGQADWSRLIDIAFELVASAKWDPHIPREQQLIPIIDFSQLNRRTRPGPVCPPEIASAAAPPQIAPTEVSDPEAGLNSRGRRRRRRRKLYKKKRKAELQKARAEASKSI